MKQCIAPDERWPDTSYEVAPDKLNDYLVHAESCTYHAERLTAEDEPFRLMFRRARGFAQDGRILLGAELDSAVEEFRRRQACWREQVYKKQMPFTYLALRNAGREIACCGEFLEFKRHEGFHLLDTEAGLQILGVLGDGASNEEVLLGFYPLANTRHSDIEHHLQLDNEYTIGLQVKQIGARTFEINFRCIGTSSLANETYQNLGLRGNNASLWQQLAAWTKHRNPVAWLPFGAHSSTHKSRSEVVSSTPRLSFGSFLNSFRQLIAFASHTKPLGFSFSKRPVRVLSFAAVILCFSCIYGLGGLTQQASTLRVEKENLRLRAENERQRQELKNLSSRVEKVEDTSRSVAAKSGVSEGESMLPGTGGPALPLDEKGLATLTAMMSRLEEDMSAYEAILRQRGYTPSIWPVEGTLEGGFGGRRNPFGGEGYEFHSGQDIEAPWGAPVVSGAAGQVLFVGWQNGYGQVVIVDHGGGLTTRYGHLSHITVELNQKLARGEIIGRIGSTGRSTGPHLHYEIRINDQPINPLRYLVMTQK